ncbi:MAG: hypothetical protein M1482_04045 [Chloroflexi bacterium]|nr:hypothetical protein [Chloroflexota bacterium]
MAVYTTSSSSMERTPYEAAKPPVVVATEIAESPTSTAPVVVVSRGFVENASTGEYRLAALSMVSDPHPPVEFRTQRARDDDAFLVRAGALDIDCACVIEAGGGLHRDIYIVGGHRGREARLHTHIGAGHRVARVAEIECEPVDAAIEVLLAGDMYDHARRSLAAARRGRVVKQTDLVSVGRSSHAAFKGHRIPGDGWVLGGVEAHRAVELVVVLDIERESQAGEVRARKVFQA